MFDSYEIECSNCGFELEYISSQSQENYFKNRWLKYNCPRCGHPNRLSKLIEQHYETEDRT